MPFQCLQDRPVDIIPNDCWGLHGVDGGYLLTNNGLYPSICSDDRLMVSPAGKVSRGLALYVNEGKLWNNDTNFGDLLLRWDFECIASVCDLAAMAINGHSADISLGFC